ncbi:disease resistance protein RPS6 isoform X3 [Arabidopsis lyrata subsp. lyrata]|uniref:disease resistance protein RPS6 isoform X3 n=1 Tax=Arabidopsis lyrata subsp. lyrata TaxID=81972 RepID=UPI000A29AED9|nr:disease resistance protein RPS6 isoform X3 [Arabidopsis lyrata subsp. lyrata]|eukprot:XP_020890895.1 disease resistance protein RPS6 isoform X3 [Arabidopsis lyrata subsp. lyrata]
MVYTSSSSSSSSRNWVYDIFPSFRGEDVRKNFVCHFIKELDRKLITAFKDNQIERSRSLDPELKQAIRDSRIAVVVFSKNYASSSWCLDELLEIVRCKKEYGQLVIPIFYRLDPSHVRKQTGEFGKIFEKTCQHKTKQVQNRWSRALSHVSNILGYHSVTWENEAKMIEEITNDVLGKLNITPSKDFDDFVGMEGHIAEMSSRLCLESEEVRMVGIWGPSGIGKTTIARALFNRLARHFRGSIFIDRSFLCKSTKIYSKANPDDYNMRLHLQSNFLPEILGQKHIRIDHLGAVRERLKHQKVLILLDDLDDQVVLDTLVGQTQWFGRGSRIIVITKNKHLLRAHGICSFYEVGLPSDQLALEMFSRYAFRQNCPLPGFIEFSVEVAKLVGNLPLGLNILGSYLRGRIKEDWIHRLHRLRKGLNKQIEEALRVEYEGLGSRKDKAIFRHIACLFNEVEINDIKLLLEDSDLDVITGLHNLLDNSLIHERRKTVQMHCLVQEMGKEMVRIQSKNPAKREFLVDSKDIYDVLNGNALPRLLEDMDMEGSSNLTELPDLSWAPNLTTLNLRNCPSLAEIPSSIMNLHCLKTLTLEDCTSLVSLPVNIDLISLYRLDLSGCSRFSRFPDISRNISFLILNQTAIEEVPWWINKFPKLICIEMWECTKLKYISGNISELKLLEKADFSNCEALTKASWIGRTTVVAMVAENNHTKLPVLNFINCFKLDQETLIQQSVFKHLILPGEKVPSYFTNQATGNSLVIHLLQSSFSQEFLRFRVCLVVDADKPNRSENGSIASTWVSCHFTCKDGNCYGSADSRIAIDLPRQIDNHLIIFDCHFPLSKDNGSLVNLNYDQVDLEFHFASDPLCKIKECGIRLSEVCPSPEYRPCNLNVRAHVWEGNENKADSDLDNETENGEETERSRKRIKIT